MVHLPCLVGAQAPKCWAPGEVPSQRTVIHDCGDPDWHHFAPHPPRCMLPVQLREPRVLPGWERVGRRQSRDFPPPAHPGLRSLAWCPSQLLDLGASRGLQGPPPHPHDAWGSPARLPLLSTPNWQLLLGSCSWKLPSVWNHPRSPGPCPASNRADPGGVASGHCCRAGGQQVGGPEGWVREGARVTLTLGRRTGGTLVDHCPGNSGSPSVTLGGSVVSRVLWFLAWGRPLRLWEHVSWVAGC